MISDESSSDSETGRFKSGPAKEKNTSSSGHNRERPENKFIGRSRPENDRFHRREYDIRRDDSRRDDRDRYQRRSRDRGSRFSKRSPIRHRSREKSFGRSHDKAHERAKEPGSQQKLRDESRRSKERKRSPDIKISSEGKRSLDRKKSTERKKIPEQKRSPPRKSQKSPERKRPQREVTPKKSLERSVAKASSSPEYKSKRSIVQKPSESRPPKPKSTSPIELEPIDSEEDIQVQPGSYYSMVPAVVKEKDKPETATKAEESSEIDSSDDERLRAKLLNLEKELKQTRKKKHKRRHHKSKSAKSHREKNEDSDAPAEVSSTTDIQEKAEANADKNINKVISTPKPHKDCSEEGEISSEDNTLSSFEIDSNDLRHRLKRTKETNPCASPDLREVLKSKSDVCGPALPPHLEKRYQESTTQAPAKPAHTSRAERILGPSIPTDMRKALSQREVTYESSDDEAIGPLPVGAESKWTSAHKHLEERAVGMKIKKLDGSSKDSNIKTRETWMLELPEAKAKILGLEARSFRAKDGPDMSDRSSWTDTPEERARKAAGIPSEREVSTVDLKQEAHARIIEIRDDEQEKAVKKHKKKHKRDESLLDMHQKKLKKKKKKEDKDEKNERRPFSRDVDLQVNRFDDAQKRSVIKKAQELDTRFSRGEAKYL